MGNGKKRAPKRLRKTSADRASRSLISVPVAGAGALDLLRAIPEERVWLESQQSPQTRRAYRNDVLHFMQTMHITETAEFRKVNRMAIVAWNYRLAWSDRRELVFAIALALAFVPWHLARALPALADRGCWRRTRASDRGARVAGGASNSARRSRCLRSMNSGRAGGGPPALPTRR